VLFEELAVRDVRDACDVLASVHTASCGAFAAKERRYCDGFVSLEVSPRLARDTVATVTAAKRLAAEVGRKNVMIKIPGPRRDCRRLPRCWGGHQRQRHADFALDRYNEVITAWMEGLELALTRRSDVSAIAVSRRSSSLAWTSPSTHSSRR